MTIAGPETGGLPEESSYSGRRFHISIPRLEGLNRSAVHLFYSRLNEDCPSFGLPATDLNASDLLREIQQYHSDGEDFIRHDMPIQEILFRTLLSHGNEPMTLGSLHRELTQRWSSAIRPIAIDENRLLRVLQADDYYGFAEV